MNCQTGKGKLQNTAAEEEQARTWNGQAELEQQCWGLGGEGGLQEEGIGEKEGTGRRKERGSYSWPEQASGQGGLHVGSWWLWSGGQRVSRGGIKPSVLHPHQDPAFTHGH